MSLQQIKGKYINLLNSEEESNDSDNDQWQVAYSKMKKNRTIHINAQSKNKLNIQVQSLQQKSKNIILVKQKLGQCIQNLHLKQVIIQQLTAKQKHCQQQLKHIQDQYSSLLLKNQQLVQIIKQNNKQFKEKQLKLQNTVQKYQIDNQIKRDQIQFYKNQIEKKNQSIKYQQRELQRIKLEQTQAKRYKKQNERLKMDVQRLFSIINKYQKAQKKHQQLNLNLANKSKAKMLIQPSTNKMVRSLSISKINVQRSIQKSLKQKHYLGKPLKNEKQFKKWHPQILINEVQFFLKSQHIAYNNKQFVSNLVKFIEEYSCKIKDKIYKKMLKRQINLKEQQNRKYNHSLSIRQIRQSTLKILNLNHINPLKESNFNISQTTKGNKNKYYKDICSSKDSQRVSIGIHKLKNNLNLSSSFQDKQNRRKFRTQIESKKITQSGLDGSLYNLNFEPEVHTEDLCKKLQNSLKMNNISKRNY